MAAGEVASDPACFSSAMKQPLTCQSKKHVNLGLDTFISILYNLAPSVTEATFTA
ncbi:hypothetical protein P7K49_013411, partial [Saguinus oedipus]